MKIKVHQQPPQGYKPGNELRIFSPVDNPDMCVMCQAYRRDLQLITGSSAMAAQEIVWVAVQTERVDKIVFV
jgi:hypothetical protein